MKYKVLIPVFMVVSIGLSWFSFLKGNIKDGSQYEKIVGQAEESMKKELYQEAFGYYENALDMKKSVEIEDKILDAYKKFYEEQQTEETYYRYRDALCDACMRFPEEEKYWEIAIEEYLKTQDYESAMHLCEGACESGVTSKKLAKLQEEITYSFTLGSHACESYREEYNGYFITKSGTRYARVLANGSDYEILDDLEVGGIGDYGIYLQKCGNQRIQFIDMAGIIRGKVKHNLSEFGTYSEGYCSAKKEEAYCVIDLNGKIIRENLLYAGCYQNGKVAVQLEEKKWALMDQKGEICSDYVEEIKVDGNGRYLFGERIIAKEDGKYQIFDASLKKQVKALNAVETDVPVKEGWIAFSAGDKWGFIDEKGKIKIKPQYEQAKSFSHGFAGVCKNGKWGYIDIDNQLVIGYQFRDVGYMTEYGTSFVETEPNCCELFQFNFFHKIKK